MTDNPDTKTNITDQALDDSDTPMGATAQINDTDTLRAFFAWLRACQPNKRLSQAQVDGANALLEVMAASEVKQAIAALNGYQISDKPAQIKTPTQAKAAPKMRFSAKAMAMLAEFEGFRSNPYLDSAGIPTIGFGTTYYPNGKRVAMTDAPISRTDALAIKAQIIEDDFAAGVNVLFSDEILTGNLSQGQFDALVSLAYNIGIGALKQSSVYRHIKAGNKTAAADAFLAWNKARINGKLTALAGLTKRRQAERTLFLA